ncbi:MAG: hypothetical protein P8X73_01880, partial [Ignavibacteriaceae bacterium]
GVYFADALQPIKFVAADSLESDSGFVRLRVGTDVSGFMMTLSNNTGAEEKQKELIAGTDYTHNELRAVFENMMEEKKTERIVEKIKASGETSPEAPIIEACYIGGFSHSIYWKGDVITINKPKLVIIYPSINSPNDTIKDEPQMPKVICKAQIKNYNGGPLTFEWEYKVTYTYERFTYDKDGNQVDLCPRISTTIFNGVSHSYIGLITEWEVPFIRDSASFNYQGIYRKNCNHVLSNYEGGNDIFTGGNVFVELTVKNRYDEIISSIGKIGNRIIGDNPEISEVKNGLTTHEQITVFLESRPKWKHFNETDRNDYNRIGNPIYGYPDGFGLMQADYPSAKEFQLWNWKANRELGKNILNEKINRAEGYPGRVRNFSTWYKTKAGKIKYRDPIAPYNEDWYPRAFKNALDFSTDEDIWKETYQRYRGGNYWKWEPDDPRDENSTGEWIVSPSQSHNRGEEAWDIYEGIQTGNYPNGWN